MNNERLTGQPSKITPDCVVPNKNQTSILYQYIIEFNVKSSGVKGCAVIYSSGPNSAIQTLKNNGMYNGTPFEYEITRCEEICVPNTPMLVCEQINSY